MPNTSFTIDRSKLYALVGQSFGAAGGDSGQPDPDHPLKPGPWDPVIRVALKDLAHFDPSPQPWRVGPQPEPWISAALGHEVFAAIARRFPAIWDVIGGGRHFGDTVSLNPQPLPPRAAFVAALGAALVARVELLSEIGSATAGEERGIIIVSGYVSRLVDEYCGTGFRWRWPFPGPPPPWFLGELDGRDLLGLGASMNSAAGQASDAAVARALNEASAKLADAGVQRL